MEDTTLGTPVTSVRLPQPVFDAIPDPRSAFIRNAVTAVLVERGFLTQEQADAANESIGVFPASAAPAVPAW